jgi:hypothetical protein
VFDIVGFCELSEVSNSSGEELAAGPTDMAKLGICGCALLCYVIDLVCYDYFGHISAHLASQTTLSK